MENIKIQDIINATKGMCDEKFLDLTINHINKDTRTIKEGDLYLAIVGENFDGHAFVGDAINKGAKAVMVSQSLGIRSDFPVITVKDTIIALQQLASFYREKLAKPVIAITGSVGKTSTKDMIKTVLSARYNVHRSLGNYNNEIGMPLSVLDLKEEHDTMVLEMGMSELGEIRTLTNIARPSIAGITNIGISHIENLGTQENILKAKLEIAEGLRDDGVLILNANDPFLQTVDKTIAPKVVYVGIDIDADYKAYNIQNYGEKGMRFMIQLKGSEYEINTPAIGIHNVTNALFGIACGIELGLTPDEIVEAFKTYEPEKMRLNILEKDGIKFIDDSYNASPDSMEAGLKVLKSIAKNNRSIAILGNMFELGDMAPEGHYTVGNACKELGIDFTAIIGENAKDIASGLGADQDYKIFKSHEEIVDYMKHFLKPTDVVLLKGSRGMAMEKILKLW